VANQNYTDDPRRQNSRTGLHEANWSGLKNDDQTENIPGSRLTIELS